MGVASVSAGNVGRGGRSASLLDLREASECEDEGRDRAFFGLTTCSCSLSVNTNGEGGTTFTFAAKLSVSEIELCFTDALRLRDESERSRVCPGGLTNFERKFGIYKTSNSEAISVMCANARSCGGCDMGPALFILVCTCTAKFRYHQRLHTRSYIWGSNSRYRYRYLDTDLKTPRYVFVSFTAKLHVSCTHGPSLGLTSPHSLVLLDAYTRLSIQNSMYFLFDTPVTLWDVICFRPPLISLKIRV